MILCVVPAHKEDYLGKINVNRLCKLDNDACTPNTDTIEEILPKNPIIVFTVPMLNFSGAFAASYK